MIPNIDDLFATPPSELIDRLKMLRAEAAVLDAKIDLCVRLLAIQESEGRVHRVDIPQTRDPKTGHKRPPATVRITFLDSRKLCYCDSCAKKIGGEQAPIEDA